MIGKYFLRVNVMVAVVAFLLMSVTLVSAADNAEIASFSVGYGVGSEMSKSTEIVDSKQFIAGFKDAFDAKQALYSQEEMKTASDEIGKIVQQELEKQKVSKPEELKDIKLPQHEKDVISYISGFSFANQLGVVESIFNKDELLKGLNAALAGEKNPYSEDEQQKAMMSLQEAFTKKMTDNMQELAEPQIESGKKFASEFEKKDGVKKTPEGLLYEVINVGTGDSPKPTDNVKVHYTGSLIDGTVFDSSVDKDPVVFNASEVVDGWKMILPRMKVGDKWKVVIPQELAYGLQGVPSAGIMPGATLIFEMELLGIEK